jgi:4-hydroxybenzoyl-CoA thioesterase
MKPGPFFHSRRVAFGECDPARIYYTPRAVDYAVEAIEAWYGSVLGISFAELIDRNGLEAYFLRADCDFIRPLVAGQVFRMRVTVGGIEGENIRFRVEGGNDFGEPYFRVELLACFAERNGHSPVPIPPEHRNRMEVCREPRGGEVPFREAGKGFPRKPGRSAGAALFTRRRRVLYGDCGPSGTIHPPKPFEYATEAIGEWFEEIMGVSWLELVSVRMQGAPMVAALCEYMRPMVSGQKLTMGVLVTRLGKASIGFAVAGRDADGVPCFDAQMVVCYIDQREGFRSMPIPEEFHVRIEAYRAACEAGGRKTQG